MFTKASNLIGAALLFSACQLQAAVINSRWVGGCCNKYWEDAINWSPPIVPNNGGGNTFIVTIDAGTNFVDVILTQDHIVDRLNCYSSSGKYNVDIGGYDNVQLTLISPHGLSNYGILGTDLGSVQFDICGNVHNFGTLEFNGESSGSHDDSIDIEGDLYNSENGEIDIDGGCSVHAHGIVENRGLIANEGIINGATEHATLLVLGSRASLIGPGTFNIKVVYKSDEIYGTYNHKSVDIMFDRNCLTKGGAYTVKQIAPADFAGGRVSNLLKSSVFDVNFDGEFCDEFEIAIPYDRAELESLHIHEENLIILHETGPGTYERLEGTIPRLGQGIATAKGHTFGKYAIAYPRTFGLIIGVNDGVGVRGDLDAQHVHDVLRHFPNWAPFDAGNPDAPLILFLSSPLSKFQIESILYDMRITDVDTFVLYFSGHGGQVFETGLETLFYIHGLPDSSDEALQAGTDFISDEYLPRLFRNAKWEKVNKVFILDACYAGGFVGTSFWDSGDLETLQNFCLMAGASETSETFSDRDGTGVWTNHLLPLLRTLPFDQIRDYMLSIRDVLISKYEGLRLPLRDFHYAGELGSFEYDPVFVASEDFATNRPLFGIFPSIRGDLDGSGNVDGLDFSLFAEHWIARNCTEPDWCDGADLDLSGDVNTLDLAIFVEHWLEDTAP